MIPIRDNLKRKSVPIVTILLIFLNISVFIYQVTLGEELTEFVTSYAVVPVAIIEALRNPLLHYDEFVTLLTALFIHGGIFHILGNMIYLWIFGDNIEDRVGHFRFLLFYLSCGVISILTHSFFHSNSGIPLIGASGAIAGVLGAYIILYPFARIYVLIPLIFIFPIIRLPALLFLGGWFIIQIVSGWGAMGNEVLTGIAWWAHAGGFAGGAILIFLFKKFR